MKDEIKEILDKLKDKNWYEELDLTGMKWIELEQKETKLLLDYITNLKQENEELKIECSQLENIDYLEEINRERTLRKLNDEIKDKYKSRIDKAIEILKLCNSKCAKETINILTGDINE